MKFIAIRIIPSQYPISDWDRKKEKIIWLKLESITDINETDNTILLDNGRVESWVHPDDIDMLINIILEENKK